MKPESKSSGRRAAEFRFKPLAKSTFTTNDGTINRHYYEMAVLTELRNYVRSGDVSIVGSRQHKDFEEYLVPKAD